MKEKYNNIEKYDVIIGPTADDRMFDTLNMFFSNNITLTHCIQALNSMDLDIQYNLRSEKSIEQLKFVNNIELDELDKEYYFEEIKSKKIIMNKKMNFIRKKFGKEGKYFDEICEEDLNG